MIRKANISDAKRLSQIAEETFRITFSAMNTASNMNAHCARSYSEAIQSAEISDPDRMTLLCENEGKLIGFAQLC